MVAPFHTSMAESLIPKKMVTMFGLWEITSRSSRAMASRVVLPGKPALMMVAAGRRAWRIEANTRTPGRVALVESPKITMARGILGSAGECWAAHERAKIGGNINNVHLSVRAFILWAILPTNATR